jgi:hypothetical protein
MTLTLLCAAERDDICFLQCGDDIAHNRRLIAESKEGAIARVFTEPVHSGPSAGRRMKLGQSSNLVTHLSVP